MIRILVDPVACDAYGYCAELLPEAITLDESGLPTVDGSPLAPELIGAGKLAPRTVPGRHHVAGAQERSLRGARRRNGCVMRDRP